MFLIGEKIVFDNQEVEVLAIRKATRPKTYFKKIDGCFDIFIPEQIDIQVECVDGKKIWIKNVQKEQSK